MNASTGGNLDSLKKFITELANTAYSQERKGMLLSRVGEIIAKEHPELRGALGGRKLVEFIETELDGAVSIHTSPENRIVKIILPASVTVDGDVMNFIPVRTGTSSSAGSAPRYNRAFWAAFSHPLASGFTRLVGFEPQVHFEDIKGDIPAETSKKVITLTSITDTTTEPNPNKRIHKINEKISDWLQENKVDINAVLANIGKAQDSVRTSGLQKGSVLEQLLDSLDDAELKRIQIPLDIVAKLNRRP